MRRALAAVMLAVVAAGCGNSSEPPAKRNVITSTENKLPRGFPPDFPLPGDWKVVYSRAEPTGVSAFFRTQQSTAETKALMLSQLPAKGWTLIHCSTVNTPQGSVDEIAATNSGVLGTIVVGAANQVSEQVRESYSFTVTLVRTGAAPPTGPGCS